MNRQALMYKRLADLNKRYSENPTPELKEELDRIHQLITNKAWQRKDYIYSIPKK